MSTDTAPGAAKPEAAPSAPAAPNAEASDNSNAAQARRAYEAQEKKLRGELAALQDKLRVHEDASKGLEQLKAERDAATKELEAIRAKEVKRLDAAREWAAAKAKDWPEEALGLLGLDSMNDADEVRARVDRVAALLAKGQPPAMPGGKAAPDRAPAIDLSGYDKAVETGDVSARSAAYSALVKQHGAQLVRLAMAARQRR